MPTPHVISCRGDRMGSSNWHFRSTGCSAKANIEVVWPDLSNPLADYSRALEQALDSPVGMTKLEQMVQPGARVAIVVDDPSRWTPVREALPIVLRRLHAAGVGREDVTISVGVGRHHAVDAERDAPAARRLDRRELSLL